MNTCDDLVCAHLVRLALFAEPVDTVRNASVSPLDSLTFGKKPKSGPLAMKPSMGAPAASLSAPPAPAPAPTPAALRRPGPAGHVAHKEPVRDFTVARVDPKPRNVSGIMHPRARRVEVRA